MRELAPGVWHVRAYRPGFGAAATWLINAYVIDDVLIDAATRHSAKRILRDLKGHEIRAHALTHAHPDHQGASAEVCDALGIPFWCPAGDVDVAENPDLIRERQGNHPIARFFRASFVGPGHEVDRALRADDEVGGFRVIETPGHSPGHVAFWRGADRILIIGDVLTNMDQLTGRPGLREPKLYLTPDPAENRRSARKLLPLEPELVLFGHGKPLRDPSRVAEFVEALPD